MAYRCLFALPPPPLMLLLLLLLAVRSTPVAGNLSRSGQSAVVGSRTLTAGFRCYRPLGPPARWLWLPRRHRQLPPATTTAACICRCNADGYHFAVFLRAAQPVMGPAGRAGERSHCFCMNHWNKRLRRLPANRCTRKPTLWIAYKLLKRPRMVRHCRGARVAPAPSPPPPAGRSGEQRGGPPTPGTQRPSGTSTGTSTGTNTGTRPKVPTGPHVVHVYHYLPATRPPVVQHVHVNVHQNQAQNVKASSGSGSGSGSGSSATAGASSNAVVNVHVNGPGGAAGPGGTIVSNALGSNLAASAPGSLAGGGPSSAGASQQVTSSSSVGGGGGGKPTSHGYGR